MNELFVPYQPSLALKELGFDELCLGYYELGEFVFRHESKQQDELKLNCSAPTFSQAFRWFREKYKLKGGVKHAISNGGYTYAIWKWRFDNNVGKWERIGVINSWLTYEESELECLKKLIEICKKK